MEILKSAHHAPFWIGKKVTCPKCFAVFKLEVMDTPVPDIYPIGFCCETKKCTGVLRPVSHNLKGSVETLELKARITHCLIRAGYKTVEDLITARESELLKISDFGRKSLCEVKYVLQTKGLGLGLSKALAKELLSIN